MCSTNSFIQTANNIFGIGIINVTYFFFSIPQLSLWAAVAVPIHPCILQGCDVLRECTVCLNH